MARFRRSPVARAGSCVFALLAVLFAAALLTPSGLPLRAGEEAAMLAVLAAALASLTLTFGDRWEVGEEQLRYDNSWAKLKTYYIQDQNPLINRTDVRRGLISTGRYRATLATAPGQRRGPAATSSCTATARWPRCSRWPRR